MRWGEFVVVGLVGKKGRCLYIDREKPPNRLGFGMGCLFVGGGGGQWEGLGVSG